MEEAVDGGVDDGERFEAGYGFEEMFHGWGCADVEAV